MLGDSVEPATLSHLPSYFNRSDSAREAQYAVIRTTVLVVLAAVIVVSAAAVVVGTAGTGVNLLILVAAVFVTAVQY